MEEIKPRLEIEDTQGEETPWLFASSHSSISLQYIPLGKPSWKLAGWYRSLGNKDIRGQKLLQHKGNQGRTRNGSEGKKVKDQHRSQN